MKIKENKQDKKQNQKQNQNQKQTWKLLCLFTLFACIGIVCIQIKEVQAANPNCIVVYMNNEGSVVPSQTFMQGSTISTLPTPTREGYSFGGWYLDEGLSTSLPSSYYIPVQNTDSVLVLFAKWKKAGIQSVIASYKTQSEVVGKVLDKNLLTVTVLYLDGTTKVVTDYKVGDLRVSSLGANMFTVTYENMTSTFYVIGTPERFYTITFITNGGTNIAPITGIKEGNVISLPAEPTRGGYSFKGWFQDQAFKLPATKDTKVTGNIILFAKWSKDEIYNEPVTYSLNTKDMKLKLNTQEPLFIPSYNGDLENYIVYSSSKKSVASVDSQGIVTGNAIGEATIYVIAPDGSRLTCKVHVIPERVIKNLVISKTSKKMKVKETYKIKSVISPRNASIKRLSYTSSNANIAKVSVGGTIMAIKKGTCYITVKTRDGSKLYKKMKVVVQ